MYVYTLLFFTVIFQIGPAVLLIDAALFHQMSQRAFESRLADSEFLLYDFQRRTVAVGHPAAAFHQVIVNLFGIGNEGIFFLQAQRDIQPAVLTDIGDTPGTSLRCRKARKR